MAHPVLRVQAVRDGENYTLSLPRVGSETSIRVNGEPVEGASSFLKHVSLLTVIGRPTVECFTAVSTAVRYRSLEEGRPDMTVSEWRTESARLLERCRRTEDGETVWPDIADEIASARHHRAYREEVRVDWVKSGDVLVEVSDKVQGEPFIIPMRMLGGDYMSAVATYHQPGFMLEWLEGRMEKAGFTKSNAMGTMARGTFKIFHHNGEVSLYLPGGFSRKVLARVITDSFDTLRKIRDADAALLEGWVSSWFANVARPVNAMEVGEDLRLIRAELSRLQTKVSSDAARFTLLRRVDALITKVETADRHDQEPPNGPDDAMVESLGGPRR